MTTNFLELATTLKYSGAKWLPEKKVNFTPWMGMGSGKLSINYTNYGLPRATKIWELLVPRASWNSSLFEPCTLLYGWPGTWSFKQVTYWSHGMHNNTCIKSLWMCEISITSLNCRLVLNKMAVTNYMNSVHIWWCLISERQATLSEKTITNTIIFLSAIHP